MPLARALLCGSIAIFVSACLAAPPRTVHAASGWKVKSDRGDEARAVCTMFERLEPRLGALVPDWRMPVDGQVWIQEEPQLYAFPAAAKSEAEGLWAEDQGCILLARDADDIERTLAHEMVHAGLGPSWRVLPGSLEEGLCDWIAAQACPEGAARLRAGRLSSAALAVGGLELELDLEPRESATVPAILQHLAARIVLVAEDEPLAQGSHLDVFRLQAGLSSTRIEVDCKRAYYGLSYLLIQRVVEREGLAGLQELCRRARARELSRVPTAWLLDAAGLSVTAEDWRDAAIDALGEEELVEIVRMYPDFVVGAVARAAELAAGGDGDPAAGLERICARVSLRGGTASIDAASLDFIRESVLARLERQSASASKRQ